MLGSDANVTDSETIVIEQPVETSIQVLKKPEKENNIV